MSGRGPGCASPTQINKEVLQLLNRFYKKTEDVCVCVRVRDKQFRLFLQTHFCVNVLVTLQEDHIQIRLHTHTTYTHARALTHNIHMHTRTHTRTHVHMHRCWSIPPRGVFASNAHTPTHTRTHTHTHIHTYTHVHTYTRTIAQVLVDPSTGRVRITSCGLVDAIAGDPTLTAEHAEDGAHQAHRADISVGVESYCASAAYPALWARFVVE